MKLVKVLAVGMVLGLGVGGCVAQDAKGCVDSPLLSRFPGSVITSCDHKPDGQVAFDMAVGNKKIEGEFTEIRYQFPSTASKAQVVRNVTTALKTAGYTFDYDSGGAGLYTAHMGGTWIGLGISSNGSITERIVKMVQLTQDVVASAAQLSTGLMGTGHAVVPGILFDTGKAEIKPESAAALAEVAKMLTANAGLKVFVVGHTDNVGALAGNMDLSKRRAAAVAAALGTTYGIGADRLSAYGDGPYAPVASNDTEDGRTLNRRVELVKQ